VMCDGTRFGQIRNARRGHQLGLGGEVSAPDASIPCTWMTVPSWNASIRWP
jgi:hypothetical protein